MPKIRSIEEIILDTHKRVDKIRRKDGLVPWDWSATPEQNVELIKGKGQSVQERRREQALKASLSRRKK